MVVKLKRVLQTEKVTIGEFTFDGISLYSLERPWVNNQRMISCIPEGLYKVKKTYSPRFKKQMWQILNVPDRTGIRIHPANYVHQLNGCVSLGMNKADINGDGIMDVTSSRKAHKIAEEHLPDEFMLHIYS